MATAAKKTTPAKTAAATKKGADVDDLLSGKGTPAKKAGKAAAADDDLLSGKAAKGKGKAAAAAPAKTAAKKVAAKETTGTVDDIKAVLLKTKKLTSYGVIADENEFDIRAVRRTARAMRDEGLIELVKEGTVVYVKKA